jgi:hypothetical protein
VQSRGAKATAPIVRILRPTNAADKRAMGDLAMKLSEIRRGKLLDGRPPRHETCVAARSQ